MEGGQVPRPRPDPRERKLQRAVGGGGLHGLLRFKNERRQDDEPNTVVSGGVAELPD